MKVKNIMFSGFMAVILMGVAGNASAAVQIASKAYVDGRVDIAETTTVATELGKKADKDYVGTIPEGAAATSIVGYVQEKTSGIASQGAMTELTNRVGIAEGKVTALEGKMTTAESDIDTLQGDMTTAQGNITSLQSAMTGNGEGSVAKKISDALVGYATEDYVGTQIQSATENMATDTEVQNAINALSATGGAIANLSGTVDGISGRVTELENADYQNANQVSSAITSAITGLDLEGTYETKGEAAKVQANVNTLSGTVDGISAKVTANEGAISTLQGDVATKAAASDVTALGERVTTAEGEIDTLQSDMTAAQGNITTLQGDVAKKVDQTAYDTKVNELNTAIAGNTTKIGENTAKIGQVEATANAAIPMPEGACATGANCVLSTVGGTIQWVNITEPLQ